MPPSLALHRPQAESLLSALDCTLPEIFKGRKITKVCARLKKAQLLTLPGRALQTCLKRVKRGRKTSLPTRKTITNKIAMLRRNLA